MRTVLIVLLSVLAVIPVAAQECEYGQPCLGVPWRIDPFPVLPSPTPFPTAIYTLSLTPSAIGTLTPTAAPTVIVTLTGLDDQIGTLRAVMQATPVSFDERLPTLPASEMASDSGTFLGYAVGLTNIHFGALQPLWVFFIGSIALIITTSVNIILLPVLIKAWGILRKLVEFIRSLLPG